MYKSNRNIGHCGNYTKNTGEKLATNLKIEWYSAAAGAEPTAMVWPLDGTTMTTKKIGNDATLTIISGQGGGSNPIDNSSQWHNSFWTTHLYKTYDGYSSTPLPPYSKMLCIAKPAREIQEYKHK